MERLIKRISTGWTFIRGFYVAIGTFVLVQSVLQQQWIGVFIGAYFASMGIFSFGCAAGNCVGGNCDVEISNNNNSK